MKKESLVKFYQSYKFYIFPAAVALSSFFLILFAIYPQTVKLIDNQKMIGDTINKTKLLAAKAETLEMYDEKDLSRKVGLALQVLPSDKEFGNIIGLLQQLSAESGFSINSISLGNTSKKLSNSDSFEVKLEIKGAKPLFQTLLTNLENSRRLVKINNMDITSSQISQSFDALVGLEVLYSKAPQNFGTIDSTLPQISQKDEDLIIVLTKMSEKVSSPSAVQLSPRGKFNPFE